MKWTNTALFLLVLIMPLTLPAASNNSARVTFDHTVIVAGNRVPAGNYRLQWEGAGPSVKASIIQGKKVIATARATLVVGKSQYHHAVETEKDGPFDVLRTIDLKNESLHFEQGSGRSAQLGQ